VSFSSLGSFGIFARIGKSEIDEEQAFLLRVSHIFDPIINNPLYLKALRKELRLTKEPQYSVI